MIEKYKAYMLVDKTIRKPITYPGDNSNTVYFDRADAERDIVTCRETVPKPRRGNMGIAEVEIMIVKIDEKLTVS